MPDTIILLRQYCQACDTYALHILTNTGDLECLQCRAEGIENIPVHHHPDQGDNHGHP